MSRAFGSCLGSAETAATSTRLDAASPSGTSFRERATRARRPRRAAAAAGGGAGVESRNAASNERLMKQVPAPSRIGAACLFRAITTVYVRAPPPAAAAANAPGGRALGAEAHRTLARRQGISVSARLARCEMPFDVWALATVARKLGFHCCGRWGPAVLVRLYDATVGSSLASPATSLHGSWLDGSLLSTLPGLCGASPGPLGWPAGPGRAATGAMAR